MMESKYKRVFITGASGTGKTTLAKAIQEQFKLPYISTSASKVWDKFGFKTHAQAHRHACYDTRIGDQYQHEVLKQRIVALEGVEKFVSDRSPFDNYAYYLMQIGYQSGDLANKVFRKMCEDHLYLADALIFLRYPKGMEIKDNSRRILNPEFQKMVDAVINLVVKNVLKHEMPVLEINTWDFEEKEKQIIDFLKHE